MIEKQQNGKWDYGKDYADPLKLFTHNQLKTLKLHRNTVISKKTFDLWVKRMWKLCGGPGDDKRVRNDLEVNYSDYRTILFWYMETLLGWKIWFKTSPNEGGPECYMLYHDFENKMQHTFTTDTFIKHYIKGVNDHADVE